MRLIYFLEAAFLILVSACSIPSLNVSPISYIYIDKMVLETNSSEGSNNHNFKDAWIYQEGKSIGIYELPKKVAIINQNQGMKINISFQAGIRDNGINSSSVVYPFVGNFETEIMLNEGMESNIMPKFRYLEATKFRMVADFEGVNLFGFDEDGDSTTNIVITDETAASGVKSGKILLQPNEVVEEATKLVFNGIPTDGSPVYLEIDYKGNIDLNIGLIGISGDQIFKDYFVSLRSEKDWKKAYINFTELIVASNLNGYQVLLAADNSNSTLEGLIYVDNIKFLHF